MGNKLWRKIKRKNIAKNRREAQKDMNEKTSLFFDLSEECSACEKSFDKTDKDMVSSWNVVVKEQEKVVRLYCPSCWNTAHQLIEDIKKRGIKNDN